MHLIVAQEQEMKILRKIGNLARGAKSHVLPSLYLISSIFNGSAICA